MGLKEYRGKRDFKRTPEPSGKPAAADPDGRPKARKAAPGAVAEGPRFVVQKHDASHLHYDFRLEMDGVLKSWAVPKGPSLDPAQKRLAVRTEDHPLEYADFEGTIPEGEYGGGTVMVWDIGPVRYEGSQAETAALVEGRKPLVFELAGSKLAGRWRLVPFNARGEKQRNWLLVKSRDDEAHPESDVLKDKPDSATSGRSLEEIAASGEQWSDKDTQYGQ